MYFIHFAEYQTGAYLATLPVAAEVTRLKLFKMKNGEPALISDAVRTSGAW
jgi:hypothetical protein